MDGDGLGLKVKITPEIDRSQLNAEAKKVEDTLKKSSDVTSTSYLNNLDKLIKKNKDAMRYSELTRKYGTNDPNKIAWGETYGKANGPRGKLEGLFEGLGGKLGGGGLGKAAVAGGVAGLAMAGIQGILEILKKMFSLLLEASPQLRAILKMLNQGFMMILRPIGDALATMLRPIAQFFRVIGRQVMKQVRAKRAELKSQGYSGAALGAALLEEMPTIYLQVLIDALQNIDWGDLWDKYLDLVWKNITERFPAFLATLWQGFLDMRQGLIDSLAGVGKWLYGVIADAGKYGLDQLAGFGTWLYNVITGKISIPQALADIGFKFYDIFVTIYNALASFANMIPGVNIAMMKTWEQMMSEAKTAAYNNTVTARSAPTTGSHAYAYKDREIQYLAGGGQMTSDGLVYAHAGEVVKDSGSIKQMIAEAVAGAVSSMGGGNATVVIPGSAISDAIDRRIDTYFRTRVVARR